MKKCIKYLYCFNSLSAKKIEILIIIFSLIGTLFTIIDIAVIHWKYTKKVMKVFYIFSLIFLLLLILFSSFFIYIRKKHNIQLLDKGSKLNKICIIICYIELFLCVFSIFIQLFVGIGCLPDLHDYNNRKDMSIYDPNNPDESSTMIVSNGEFSFAILSIIINIFIWIENFLLCLSYIIRIKFGINGSYRRYLNEQKNEETFPKEIIESQNNIVNPIFKKEEEKLKEKSIEKKDIIIFEPLSGKLNNENKNNSFNKYDSEKKDILRYSYKQNLKTKQFNSVDDVKKLKNEKFDKEKYYDKYLEGYGANPFYSNFGNKSILNISTMNNSINPGNSYN